MSTESSETLEVTPCPFWQTITTPCCDNELDVLIRDDDVGGVCCDHCGTDIDYVRADGSEAKHPEETEQLALGDTSGDL